MLNAILGGKKRGTGVEGESLAESFSGAEDTLTATVFERIGYLPDPIVSQIVWSPEIWGAEDAVDPGRLIAVQFWPRWPGSTSNSQVEPDCVFEFERAVLVVEAKRHDLVEMQSAQQLAREWAAAQSVYNGQIVRLLAVGGLRDSTSKTAQKLQQATLSALRRIDATDPHHGFRMAAVPWSKIADVIWTILDKSRYERIAEDIRAGMLLHGIAVEAPSWLTDLVGSASPWSSVRTLRTHEAVFRSSAGFPRLLPCGISTRPEVLTLKRVST